MRFGYHVYMSEMQPYENDAAYITEQTTPLFSFLRTKIKYLTGSEYVGADISSGEVTENGIRHEDSTQLSLADNSLDKLISFDCLEHIPNFEDAIAECYRTLKPDGSMLMSFPFDRNEQNTLCRASIASSGEITHFIEPEYHGDPYSETECLSYYTFGWDVLDCFRSAGFKDVYAVMCCSDLYGYLGREQIAFIAKK
jgi:SAM-dependent methyltransferase